MKNEQKQASDPLPDNHQDIKATIKANLYDTKVLDDLEKYVVQQAKDNTYDFDANRHLLKLYTFAPDTIKIDTVQKILLLSLKQLPFPHFLACTYLLREKLHEDEEIKQLMKLSNLLETAQFKKYWQAAEESKTRTMLDKIPTFDASIRSFIATTIENTYQTIPATTVKDLLHLGSVAELDAFTASVGWTSYTDDKGAKLIRVGKEHHQCSTASKSEKISLTEISKLMAELR
jgi:hypothetical protein